MTGLFWSRLPETDTPESDYVDPQLEKALGYLDNHWDGLIRFLDVMNLQPVKEEILAKVGERLFQMADEARG